MCKRRLRLIIIIISKITVFVTGIIILVTSITSFAIMSELSSSIPSNTSASDLYVIAFEALLKGGGTVSIFTCTLIMLSMWPNLVTTAADAMRKCPGYHHAWTTFVNFFQAAATLIGFVFGMGMIGYILWTMKPITASAHPSKESMPLIIQFSVKHDSKIDCGGIYANVTVEDNYLADLHGYKPHYITFGNTSYTGRDAKTMQKICDFTRYLLGPFADCPDLCADNKKIVHVIFSYKGKSHLVRKDILCKDDGVDHVYTLVLKPDHSYEAYIDNANAQSGTLENDWDFFQSKILVAMKQADWNSKEYVEPEHIPDRDAKKPEGWDDETDGIWEPPQITNPKYKGEWKPHQIKNPEYSGESVVHRESSNMGYTLGEYVYRFNNSGTIGVDLWQVKSGATGIFNVGPGATKTSSKKRGRRSRRVQSSEKSPAARRRT